MLNWSYQSTKPCSVLVGDNTQFVPSKTATSETNLSTSSRPKTSNSGGNFLQLVYSRKRRQVDNNQTHAFVFSNSTSRSLSTVEHENIDREHASTPQPLHDQDTGTPLKIVTNSTSEETTLEPTTILPTTEELPNDDNYQFDVSDDDSHSFLDESQLQDDPDSFFDNVNIDEESKQEIEDTDEFNLQPIFSYGEDEIKIIKLNHEPFSTTMKSKTNYSIATNKSDNSKELTDSNLSILPNSDIDLSLKGNTNFNNPSLMHGNNATNHTKEFENNLPPNPKIKIIEVPPVDSSTSSKRVLVNVTIATDPDSNNPYATHSVYVLSVSVPTDDNANESANDVNVKQSFVKADNTDKKTTQTPVFEEKREEGVWGGACECSCPCLEGSGEITDTNSTEYDYVDVFYRSNITTAGSIENASTDSTETTTPTSEAWFTSTVCPEVTTKLPPPPTILILEGRAFKKKSLAN